MLSSGERVRFNYRSEIVAWNLTVRLGDTLNLILLLYGVAVRGPTGSVNDLVGETLGDGLDVSEGGLSSTHGHEVQRIVHSSEGRHVDRLSLDRAGAAYSRGILSWAAVDDGVNEQLYGVLVGEHVDQLQGVAHDAAGHQLLAVVAAEAHHGTGEALNDGALIAA